MHEMSIAMRIAELAEAEARTAGAGRISRIELEVGALAGVMVESLRFCFAAACRDTLADGAELVVVEVPGWGVCASCRRGGAMDQPLALCSACGGIMRPSGGRELRLLALEIDE